MAFKYNLPAIEAGAVFDKKLYYRTKDANGIITAVDLTGYEALIQGRKKAGSPVLFEWGSSEITLGADGGVHLFIDAHKTKDYAFTDSEYDCLIWPTGNPHLAECLFHGTVKCGKAITAVPGV